MAFSFSVTQIVDGFFGSRVTNQQPSHSTTSTTPTERKSSISVILFIETLDSQRNIIEKYWSILDAKKGYRTGAIRDLLTSAIEKKQEWQAWAASYPFLNQVWIKPLVLEAQDSQVEFTGRKFPGQIYQVSEKIMNEKKIRFVNAMVHDSRYCFPCEFPPLIDNDDDSTLATTRKLENGTFVILKEFSLKTRFINQNLSEPYFLIKNFTFTYGDILPNQLNLQDARRIFKFSPSSYTPYRLDSDLWTSPKSLDEFLISSLPQDSIPNKSEISQAPSARVLKSKYPNIVSLKEFLVKTWELDSKKFARSNDTDEYKKFLSTTFVEYDSECKIITDFFVKSLEGELIDSLRKVVLAVIHSLLQQYNPQNMKDYDIGNILMRGYWTGNVQDGMINHYPNTIIGNLIHSENWQTLYQRIGKYEFASLLRWTSIFVYLCNDCYYQVSGIPFDTVDLHRSKKRVHEESLSEFSRKIPRFDIPRFDESFQSIVRSHSAIIFKRDFMFCKRAIETRSNYHNNSENLDILEKVKRGINGCDSEWVLSQIFKEEFKLTGKPFDDGLDCEHEDNTTALECLQPALALVKKIITSHKRIRYAAYLKKFCPVKSKNIGSRIPKEVVTPFEQVSNFVQGILEMLIPAEFWGCQHNQNVVFTAVDRFVRLGKFERMTLHDALQCFKMKHCTWIDSHDVQRRERIISEFILWIFDGLVIPLLYTSFYITDTQSGKNLIFYFRQDIWKEITEIEFDQFIEKKFKKMSQESTPSNKQVIVSMVRFVPKTNGYRPIVKMKDNLM
ncbi:2042_t:CDS:10, partial [Ambispora gerdemannii]